MKRNTRKLISITTILFVQILISCGNNSKKTIETVSKTDKISYGLQPIVYQSDNLIIRKISNHIYVHKSFLQTNDFEQLACNGMIVVDNGEALIVDTPTNDQASVELIEYITDKMNCTINLIAVTNFQADCLGGLQLFHKYGISSYASNQTIELALKNKSVIPQRGFEKEFVLSVGNKKVHLEHLGEGHTSDNIVGYFPDEQVIFGGCLIKEIGAEKGNVEDLKAKAWYETVNGIKVKYPQIKTVVPGHGELGGIELLDYTMKLFI